MSSEKALYFCNILVSRLINSGKSARAIRPNTILCVKLDEIGDMVTTLAVFSQLKEAFPTSEITVLCKPFAGSLLLNNPYVSKVIYDIQDWNTAFDLVVELRGNWKTLLRSINFKYWPHYRLDRGWVRLKQRGNQPHESITNYRIIEPIVKYKVLGGSESQNHDLLAERLTENGKGMDPSIGFNGEKEMLNREKKPLLFPSSEDEAAAEIWISQAQRQAFSVKGEAPNGMAILHAGARKVLRQWPLENFSEVAKWLWDTHRIWSIWVGTSEEKSNIESIWHPHLGTLWISEEASPRNTSLLAFYALIQRASLFIGNESGPLQLAALADISIVGLFGPGVEKVFYPLGARVFTLGENIISIDDKSFLEFQGAEMDGNQMYATEKESENTIKIGTKRKAVIHCKLPCNPCDQVHCVHPENPCIRRISLNSVLQVLNNYIFTQ